MKPFNETERKLIAARRAYDRATEALSKPLGVFDQGWHECALHNAKLDIAAAWKELSEE